LFIFFKKSNNRLVLKIKIEQGVWWKWKRREV